MSGWGRRRPRHRLAHSRAAARRLGFSARCDRCRLGRGALRLRRRGLALRLRTGLLSRLGVVGLGLLARLEVAAAIALMLRVLAIAIAAAMPASTAPAAAASAACIVRAAVATVLTGLRKLLRRLFVSSRLRLVGSLLA